MLTMYLEGWYYQYVRNNKNQSNAQHKNNTSSCIVPNYMQGIVKCQTTKKNDCRKTQMITRLPRGYKLANKDNIC